MADNSSHDNSAKPPERLAFRSVSSAHIVAVKPGPETAGIDLSEEQLRERALLEVATRFMEKGVDISKLSREEFQKQIREMLQVETFVNKQERDWLETLLERGPQSANEIMLKEERSRTGGITPPDSPPSTHGR